MEVVHSLSCWKCLVRWGSIRCRLWRNLSQRSPDRQNKALYLHRVGPRDPQKWLGRTSVFLLRLRQCRLVRMKRLLQQGRRVYPMFLVDVDCVEKEHRRSTVRRGIPVRGERVCEKRVYKDRLAVIDYIIWTMNCNNLITFNFSWSDVRWLNECWSCNSTSVGTGWMRVSRSAGYLILRLDRSLSKKENTRVICSSGYWCKW